MPDNCVSVPRGFYFPHKKQWAHFASTIVEIFHFIRGQKQKVYHIFNHCEDAKQKGHFYNSEQNCFEQQKRHVVDSAGIEGQIIADVLQKEGIFVVQQKY